jgi:hypothetical protein
MSHIQSGSRQRLKEWMRRYLPAELVGTVAALLAAWVTHAVSGSLAAAAIAGSVGESLGYYGLIARRDLRHYDACHRHLAWPSRLWRTGRRFVRDMLIEFGPAELVDSLFVRPFFMYLIPSLLNNFTAGLLLGKLTADVIFYAVTISSYELKKHYLPLPQSEKR